MRDNAHTLSDFRIPTLSIECEPCGRRGRYDVARLMEKYGDAKLPELRHVLANCSKAKSLIGRPGSRQHEPIIRGYKALGSARHGVILSDPFRGRRAREQKDRNHTAGLGGRCGGAHSSGSPALIRPSRKPGGESRREVCARETAPRRVRDSISSPRERHLRLRHFASGHRSTAAG
jgi:hypothetical protein